MSVKLAPTICQKLTSSMVLQQHRLPETVQPTMDNVNTNCVTERRSFCLSCVTKWNTVICSFLGNSPASEF